MLKIAKLIVLFFSGDQVLFGVWDCYANPSFRTGSFCGIFLNSSKAVVLNWCGEQSDDKLSVHPVTHVSGL
jgi:hypothetical protein